MRIKKLKFENHEILGDLELDFTNNGKAEDIIFLAGENGCGKTTIIDIIYKLFSMKGMSKEYKLNVEFEVNEKDKNYIRKNGLGTFSEFDDDEISIALEYNKNSTRSEIINKNKKHALYGDICMQYLGVNIISKCIYSAAEINFESSKITAVTAMELDENQESEKQTPDLSKKITQLLVDIKASDDSELSDWVIKNPNMIPPDEIKEKRMKRFKDAFNYMFNDLYFDSIQNVNEHKEIYFRRNGKLISINDLSSGEKQIVYRGGFILKNVSKLENSIILIDEPELSLHPLWQQKIVEYFRRMSLNEQGEQVCQIFVSTHSPFILHSDERKNDKVIVLKRNSEGKIYLPDDKKFFKCNSLETIETAFSLNKYLNEIKSISGTKTLIITEGKTDTKHLIVAMKKLGITDLDIEFFELPENWGDTCLKTLLENLSLISKDKKIIGIFDRDGNIALKSKNIYDTKFLDLGNNVYAFSIPIVGDYGDKISIEHYYKREDLTKEDSSGRRIFLGEEFTKKSPMSKDANFYTKISNIQHKVEINGIIDEKVYKKEDVEASNSIALSKNAFADLIEDEEFSKDADFSNFEKIFNIIREILK